MNRVLLQTYERYGRWLPAAVSALLVAALGVELARLTWALVPAPEAAQWRPVATRAPVQPGGAAQAGGPNLQAILDANVFGVYVAPDSAEPECGGPSGPPCPV